MSQGPSRGFSNLLDLRRMERRSRRLLGAGYLFATAALALLTLVWNPHPRAVPTAERSDYIIHADIIERPATPGETPFRLTPPGLARRMERPGVSAPGASPGMPGSARLPGLKEPSLPFERELGREVDRLARGYTDTLTVDGGVPRGPGDRMPFRRDAGSDPGMFSADIIYNPANKTAAQGYVHIPLIRGEKLKASDRYIRGLRGLVDGINRRTNITALLDLPNQANETEARGINLKSLIANRPPVIYILADRSYPITEKDKDELRAFVAGSDSTVLIVENGEPGNEKFRDELRCAIQNIAGDIYAVEPIPKNHPLFHCFYDFRNGPPEGADRSLGAIPRTVQPYLEGIMVGGRLKVIYSDLGYGLCWGAGGNYEEQMKMGVNLVLYSLIQKRERRGHQAISAW